jgi:hypothetical protein
MSRLAFILLAATLLWGCAGTGAKKSAQSNFQPAAQAAQNDNPSKPGGDKIIVTPSSALKGSIVRVNSASRFAVLYFPVGNVPLLQTTVHVYRAGVKVGELKVNGPQLDDNIVADIIEGEAQAGDEVRTE